jgi:hypothetical protein
MYSFGEKKSWQVGIRSKWGIAGLCLKSRDVASLPAIQSHHGEGVDESGRGTAVQLERMHIHTEHLHLTWDDSSVPLAKNAHTNLVFSTESPRRYSGLRCV